MTVINTNVKSLVAAEAINGNNNRLSTAMQRLSTGLRVNSAKDDAAGLSIGTRMTAQIRGLNMAIKNANDGISLLQTAEGAMDEVTNALQRMRELAVQASSETNQGLDKAALDAEVQQLKSEINRIANQTQFNGMNILDGSFKNKNLLIGDKAENVMAISVASVNTASLGRGASNAVGTVVSGRVTVPPAVTGPLEINGVVVNDIGDNTGPVGIADDIADLVAAINTSNTGVTASAFNEVVAKRVGSGQTDTGEVVITVTPVNNGADSDVVITLGATNSLQDMANQINQQGGEGTVQARIDSEGKLVLFNNSGATILIEDASDADTNGGGGSGFVDGEDAFNGFLKLTSDSGKSFTVTSDTAADYGALGLNQVNSDGTIVASDALVATSLDPATWIPGSLVLNGVDIWSADMNIADAASPEDALVAAINQFTKETGVTAGLNADGFLTLKSEGDSPIQIKLSEALKDGVLKLSETNAGAADYDTNKASLDGIAGGGAVSGIHINTSSNALSAIGTLDGALNSVSQYRAALGAMQNRLSSTVNNLSNVVTNTQSSRSRIMDADYASETTDLARAQIIQQAATAMLAQANQSAQTVLTLLK